MAVLVVHCCPGAESVEVNIEGFVAFTAVKPEVWELDVSFETTEGSSYGQTRTTRRVTWETSGRSPLQELLMPRGLFWRRCKLDHSGADSISALAAGK